MLIIGGRCLESSTTTGTGNLTLGGAQSGYQALSAIYADGVPFPCTIAGQTGTEWESGIYSLTTGGTILSRDNVSQSSNAGALVSFSAGTKDVFAGITGFVASQLTLQGDQCASFLIMN